MAKIKNKISPFIVMILLVIAIMVLFKPVEEVNRQTYGSSREGFSRTGASEGVCDHQYEFCYWSEFEDEGTETRAQIAFETSYNTAEGINTYSFCEGRDPVTNKKNCYAGEYYYPFTFRYEVTGDLAYLKLSGESDDWITCSDNGCDADLVALSDELTYTKQELDSLAGSDGKVYFYLYGWDSETEDVLVEVLPNDFGSDVVLEEPYIESYSTWTSQGVKFVVYPSSVGECVVDDDCHKELLSCELKGQCIPIECVRNSQCGEGTICSDNYCIEVECSSDSDCEEAFCGSNNNCVADADGDLVADNIDNCPDIYNPTQRDDDKDGLGDVCDPLDNDDQDNDGVPNEEDNCPLEHNPDQSDIDGDGLGDVCDPIPDDNDKDGDGVNNFFDNCPEIFNPYQHDWDGDGLGDACDYHDDKPKTATVGEEGGIVYTFTVAETVDDSSSQNGSSITDGVSEDGYEGINYYLLFIVLTISSIIIYEILRNKK